MKTDLQEHMTTYKNNEEQKRVEMHNTINGQREAIHAKELLI